MMEQKLFLIEPSIEYDEQIQAFRKEFLACEESMDGCGSLRRFDRTQDWLEQVESLRRPETVPPGFVPSTQHIYVREADRKIVGVIQIRHYFNVSGTRFARVSAKKVMPRRCSGSPCPNAKGLG